MFEERLLALVVKPVDLVAWVFVNTDTAVLPIIHERLLVRLLLRDGHRRLSRTQWLTAAAAAAVPVSAERTEEELSLTAEHTALLKVLFSLEAPLSVVPSAEVSLVVERSLVAELVLGHASQQASASEEEQRRSLLEQ